jgi:hypothetical protein
MTFLWRFYRCLAEAAAARPAIRLRAKCQLTTPSPGPNSAHGLSAERKLRTGSFAKLVTRVSDIRIEWTVPREWHLQRVRAELRGVFNFGFFARIILVSVGLAVGIWYWVERKLGPLEFNWIRAIILSLAFGLGVLGVGVVSTLIPPTVRISAKGITVLKSQSTFLVPFSDIVAISIEALPLPVLKFRKANRHFEYAIAPSVDLDRLRRELDRLGRGSVQIEADRPAAH